MAERIVVCVIANDAHKDEIRYLDVGSNFKHRLEYALRWVEKNHTSSECLWAFGAGADKEHEGGETLSALAVKHLQTLKPDAKVIFNQTDHAYYGTLEEMTWIFERIEDYDHFVFFTQGRHMFRVRIIVQFFFPKKCAEMEFVTTPHLPGHEISWAHELRSYIKLVLIKVGVCAPRHQTR